MNEQSINSGSVLFENEDYRVPEGVRSGFLKTPDGIDLRWARWVPNSGRSSKGTILILHGRSESIEKYYETIDHLLVREFEVLTFDWRGQGGSGRLLQNSKKGHVEHFNQYLTDLETVLTEIALPDCTGPYYILGHSTGALVALLAGPALENRIRRMVLISPLLALNRLPMSQSMLQRFAGVLTFAGLGRSYIIRNRTALENRRFEGNRLTSSPERFNAHREFLLEYPALALSSPTIAWVFAACRAMAQVNAPGYSNAINIPCLLVAAGSDSVVDSAAVERFGKNMRAGSFLTVSGARHELLQERDMFREQLLAAFDAFIPGSED